MSTRPSITVASSAFKSSVLNIKHCRRHKINTRHKSIDKCRFNDNAQRTSHLGYRPAQAQALRFIILPVIAAIREGRKDLISERRRLRHTGEIAMFGAYALRSGRGRC